MAKARKQTARKLTTLKAQDVGHGKKRPLAADAVRGGGVRKGAPTAFKIEMTDVLIS
jgi:hypothetical protein